MGYHRDFTGLDNKAIRNQGEDRRNGKTNNIAVRKRKTVEQPGGPTCPQHPGCIAQEIGGAEEDPAPALRDDLCQHFLPGHGRQAGAQGMPGKQ